MVAPLTLVTVFIGGPIDTQQDRLALDEHIRRAIAPRYEDRVAIKVEFWDDPTRPVAIGHREKWQPRIDRDIRPAEKDVAIMLFRWRLGHEGNVDDKSYPSMSAYEIEQRLSLPEPNLGIFQY